MYIRKHKKKTCKTQYNKHNINSREIQKEAQEKRESKATEKNKEDRKERENRKKQDKTKGRGNEERIANKLNKKENKDHTTT